MSIKDGINIGITYDNAMRRARQRDEEMRLKGYVRDEDGNWVLTDKGQLMENTRLLGMQNENLQAQNAVIGTAVQTEALQGTVGVHSQPVVIDMVKGNHSNANNMFQYNPNAKAEFNSIGVSAIQPVDLVNDTALLKASGIEVPKDLSDTGRVAFNSKYVKVFDDRGIASLTTVNDIYNKLGTENLLSVEDTEGINKRFNRVNDILGKKRLLTKEEQELYDKQLELKTGKTDLGIANIPNQQKQLDVNGNVIDADLIKSGVVLNDLTKLLNENPNASIGDVKELLNPKPKPKELTEYDKLVQKSKVLKTLSDIKASEDKLKGIDKDTLSEKDKIALEKEKVRLDIEKSRLERQNKLLDITNKKLEVANVKVVDTKDKPFVPPKSEYEFYDSIKELPVHLEDSGVSRLDKVAWNKQYEIAKHLQPKLTANDRKAIADTKSNFRVADTIDKLQKLISKSDYNVAQRLTTYMAKYNPFDLNLSEEDKQVINVDSKLKSLVSEYQRLMSGLTVSDKESAKILQQSMGGTFTNKGSILTTLESFKDTNLDTATSKLDEIRTLYPKDYMLIQRDRYKIGLTKFKVNEVDNIFPTSKSKDKNSTSNVKPINFDDFIK